jgi:hypothetical protein
MSVSEKFAKLKDQVDQAEDNVKAAAAQNKADLEAKVNDARKSADDRAAVLRAKTQETSDDAKAHWSEVQSDWDRHIQRIRQHIDEKKAEHDVKAAERDADWAEADALDAIDFASAAIQEAWDAVLDAALARMEADALVGNT